MQVSEFYPVAAQILPVIFLTLAFQVRGGIFPSPAHEHYETMARARSKMIAALEEAQKLRYVDEDPLPTPEQLFTREAAATAYATAEADEHLSVLADRAGRGRIIASLLSLLVIALLFVGEAAALRVLATGNETDAARMTVELALLVGAAAIARPLILRYIDDVAHQHDAIHERRHHLAVALLIVLVLGTFLVWN